MDLIMTLELIPQLEPIPTWNRLHQWLFWPMESLWNRLQKNWNRNISITYDVGIDGQYGVSMSAMALLGRRKYGAVLPGARNTQGVC